MQHKRSMFEMQLSKVKDGETGIENKIASIVCKDDIKHREMSNKSK